MLFADRADAGRQLAAHLKKLSIPDPVVIALPRGGVPVAIEVASALHAPMDLLIVRKIGLPSNPEFGIGAVAEGGMVYLDDYTLERVSLTPAQLEESIQAEIAELDRRVKRYRRNRPLMDVRGRTVLLVDDGLATGVSARAAARALRRFGATGIIAAVPVSAPDAGETLAGDVDRVIAVAMPEGFRSVGRFYDEFPQLTDQEVLDLLGENVVPINGKTGRYYTSSPSASSQTRNPR